MIDVGTCIVLAGVALTAFHKRGFLCLMLLLVKVEGSLRKFIKLAREPQKSLISLIFWLNLQYVESFAKLSDAERIVRFEEINA